MEDVRERVLRLARAKGLTQGDLEKAAGVSHSTYDGMWKRGTVTLPRLQAMADLLEEDIINVIREPEVPRAPIAVVGEPPAAYGKKRYLEDRLDALEVEVRKLKEKTRLK